MQKLVFTFCISLSALQLLSIPALATAPAVPQNACTKDSDKYCKDQMPLGRAKVMECMDKNEKNLSKACIAFRLEKNAAFKKAESKITDNYRQEFRTSCLDDVDKFCSNPEINNIVKKVHCLKNKKNVSAACKNVLHNFKKKNPEVHSKKK